jgi:hypothetical protein
MTLAPTQPSQLDPATLSEEDLLLHLEDLKAALTKLKDTEDLLLDELSKRMEAGDIDPTFSHNDWAFSWSAGCTSFSYPDHVQALEAQTKAAKKAAEADGTATRSLGRPFWTIRAPKP